jgi:hypothetical protein
MERQKSEKEKKVQTARGTGAHNEEVVTNQLAQEEIREGSISSKDKRERCEQGISTR